MKIISSSNLRKNIKSYFEYVLEKKESIIVPINKNIENDAIVIISMSEYNSLKSSKETDYLLSTKANRDRLNESLSQLENNEFKTQTKDVK